MPGEYTVNDDRRFEPGDTDIPSKDIVILSLGQILGTSYEKTIEAFAEIVAAQKANGCCRSAKGTVESALWWDEVPFIGSGLMESFRKGEITNEEFHKKIDEKLGIKTTSKEFGDAWLAMSEVTVDDARRFRELLDLRDERGFKLIIVSATNKAQFGHIRKQLADFGIVLPCGMDLPVAASCIYGTTDLSKLAEKKLSWMFKDGDRIISLHNKVTKIPEYELTCRPFDSSKEDLLDVLKSVTRDGASVHSESERRDFVANSPNPLVPATPLRLDPLDAFAVEDAEGLSPRSRKSSLEEIRRAPDANDYLRPDFSWVQRAASPAPLLSQTPPLEALREGSRKSSSGESGPDYFANPREYANQGVVDLGTMRRYPTQRTPFYEEAVALNGRCRTWIDLVSDDRNRAAMEKTTLPPPL